MRYAAIVIVALCCGCASTQRNPLAAVTPEQVEDIFIGQWSVDPDFFPAPLLSEFKVFADVTMRYYPDQSLVTNLVHLVRQTEPWPEDTFIPMSYVLLKAGFVTEHPRQWLGQVTIFGDGTLVSIADDPVNPKVQFTGRNRELAQALFRIVMDEEPEALRKWKTWLEERDAEGLLKAYPFDEIPEKENTEPESGHVRK